MLDAVGKPRNQGSTLSFPNLLLSLGIEVRCTLNNAGNDAYMILVALQALMELENTNNTSSFTHSSSRPIQNRISSMPISIPSNGATPMLNLTGTPFSASHQQHFPDMFIHHTGARLSPVSPFTSSGTPSPVMFPRELQRTGSGYFEAGALHPGWSSNGHGNGSLNGRGRTSSYLKRSSLNPETILAEPMQAMKIGGEEDG